MENLRLLPPGFRFHPTNEEVVTHYLLPKIMNQRFNNGTIGEVDLNKFEPWDLPGKARIGEKEYYFFVHKDRKYPTGTRTNRATKAGYWKATGKDKEIMKGRVLAGMKKTLVFYTGRAPKGEKTEWVMHEFRLDGKYNLPKNVMNKWVVCKVFQKNQKTEHIERVDEFGHLGSLPALIDSSCTSSSNMIKPPVADNFNYTNYQNIFSLAAENMQPNNQSINNINYQFATSTSSVNHPYNAAAIYNPQVIHTNTNHSSEEDTVTIPAGSVNSDYSYRNDPVLQALASTSYDPFSTVIRRHSEEKQENQYPVQSKTIDQSKDSGFSIDQNFDDPFTVEQLWDFQNIHWDFA